MSEHKHYLTTFPHPKKNGMLLAVISKGSPQYGDVDILVCSLTAVKTQKEANEWYAREMITKPWEARQ